MSQRNVDVVREIYEGWRTGDFNVGGEHFADDIVFVSDFAFDRGTAKGRRGMGDLWREQLRHWQRMRTGEIKEIRELGDYVLAVNAIYARGSQSGAAVEIPNAAALFRFEDGKITWLMATDAVEKAERALEAA